jgi:hypothetical protein
MSASESNPGWPSYGREGAKSSPASLLSFVDRYALAEGKTVEADSLRQLLADWEEAFNALTEAFHPVLAVVEAAADFYKSDTLQVEADRLCAVRPIFCSLRQEIWGGRHVILPTVGYDHADTPVAQVFSHHGTEAEAGFAALFTAAPTLLEFVYQEWLVGEPGMISYDQAAALWRQATGRSIEAYHLARCEREGER